MTTTKKTKEDQKTPTVEELLHTLVTTVCTDHPGDKTRPSVVLSMMSDGGYYASILRYSGSYAEGKIVVCNAKAPDLPQVLVDLGRLYFDKRGSAARLASLVGR